MNKLAILLLLFSGPLFSMGQDVDMTDYEAVTKFYAENFYVGDYSKAMSVVVKDGRANGLEIRCVEMGECEKRDRFEYKLYGEKVSKVEGRKSLLIYWTDDSYIESNLEKQADDTWLVVGSPSKPSENAKPVKG